MSQESLHEEIKWLESQLEARKRALEERGESAKAEKEVLREVIKETAAAPTIPSGLAAGAVSDDQAQQAAYQLQEKKHEHIIEELAALALAKGLRPALKVANSLKNPHLLDEFHDTLADKYYEKLLEARKLK